MMAYDFSPCFSIFFLPHLRPTIGAAATSTTVSSTLPPHGVLLRPLSLCDSSLLRRRGVRRSSSRVIDSVTRIRGWVEGRGGSIRSTCLMSVWVRYGAAYVV